MDWHEEFFGLWLGDERLNKRFFAVLQSFSDRPGETIAKACSGNWSEAKSTYRLLANPKFNNFQIMELHRQKTIERMKEHPVVLALSDTSLVSYQTHLATQGLGVIGTSQKNAAASKGLVTHNLIAVTPEGVPLGLLDQRTWARTAKEDRSPDEEKESLKWAKCLETGSLVAQQNLGVKTKVVTVSDRESDINQYLQTAYENELEIVVRAMDRRLDQITAKPIKESIDQDFKSLGEFDLDVTTRYESSVPQYKRKTKRLSNPSKRTAAVSIKAGPVMIRLYGQGASQVQVPMNCVFVKEINFDQENAAKNEKPLEWVLLTTLEIKSFDDAKRVIEYYKARWFIEIFFKTLKSGCGIERSRLQHADRLISYILMMSIVSVKICIMTYLQRVEPEQNCEVVLTRTEWIALYLYFNPKKEIPKKPLSIFEATTLVARLGGFMARKSDGYPGTMRIWAGMLRLQDIHESYLRFRT